MQFNIFLSTVFTLSGLSFCNAIDLDSIFDEVSTINHDFRDIFRVVSQQVFRKDDAQPMIVGNYTTTVVQPLIVL